jgi:hypothetical protein
MGATQTLHCRACRYSWGPVGVRPWVPDQPYQAFLLCLDCRRPQSQVLSNGERARCMHCSSERVESLSRCPACDAPAVSWT